MPDFIRIREGDRRLLSLQVFKPTGSALNLSLATSFAAPHWIYSRNVGGSVMFSAASGTGFVRSTGQASGKCFVSLNPSATSGKTPGVYPMALFVYSAASGNALTRREFPLGFLVIEGQVR